MTRRKRSAAAGFQQLAMCCTVCAALLGTTEDRQRGVCAACRNQSDQLPSSRADHPTALLDRHDPAVAAWLAQCGIDGGALAIADGRGTDRRPLQGPIQN